MGSMDGNVESDIETGDFPSEPESSILNSSGCGSSSAESNCLWPKSREFTCKDVHVVVETNSGTECGCHLDFEEKSYSKKKRSRLYSNKHSKPPRPPKGPLLNASDMMLVKKISEIAAMKRERIERSRALKKMKGAKGSSCGCNLVAMVITVIFLIVIIIQGFCSRGGLPLGFRGSPEPSVANNGLINVQFYSKPPVNEMSGPINRYSNSEEPASGSVPRVQEGRDVQ
ncbi:hypothetical protein V2J09_000473 [Rumex salicifolius]